MAERGDLIDLLEHKRYRRTGGGSPYRSGIGPRKRRTVFFYRASVLSLRNKVSAIHSAAYRSRERLVAPDGTVADWRIKGDESPVLYSAITLPDGAAEKYLDRTTLWSEAQAAERRIDARYAREFLVVIPPELQDRETIKKLVDEHSAYLAAFGYAVDANVHEPGSDTDGRNIHCHFMITDRPIEGDHFASLKNDKEWRRQSHKNFLNQARETFSQSVNRELEARGLTQRVDHRESAVQFAEALERSDFELARELAQPGRPHFPRWVLEDAKRGKPKAVEMIETAAAAMEEIRTLRVETINRLERMEDKSHEIDASIASEIQKSEKRLEHLEQLNSLIAELHQSDQNPDRLRTILDHAHQQFVQPEIEKLRPAVTAPIVEKLIKVNEHEEVTRREEGELAARLDKLTKRSAIGRALSWNDTDQEIKAVKRDLYSVQRQLGEIEREQEMLSNEIKNAKVDRSKLSDEAQNFLIVIDAGRERIAEVQKNQTIQQQQEKQQQRRKSGPELGR